jgi:hypothetical protein
VPIVTLKCSPAAILEAETDVAMLLSREAG